MDVSVHIPDCVLKRQADEEPSPRDLVVGWPGDVRIGFYLETPPVLARHQILQSMVWARLFGDAILEHLEDHKPRFHRSIIKGKIAKTAGTTIALTGRTADDKHTIVAFWNYGEHISRPLDRLAKWRKFVAGCPIDVFLAMSRGMRFEELCPPQVLLSIVNGLDRPEMSLGSAPGMAPIAVAVGRKWIHVVMDHRLYDAPDECAFAGFIDKLSEV